MMADSRLHSALRSACGCVRMGVHQLRWMAPQPVSYCTMHQHNQLPFSRNHHNTIITLSDSTAAYDVKMLAHWKWH